MFSRFIIFSMLETISYQAIGWLEKNEEIILKSKLVIFLWQYELAYLFQLDGLLDCTHKLCFVVGIFRMLNKIAYSGCMVFHACENR